MTDVVVSLLLILLTSPIAFIIAVVIRLTSPGPVLFRQKRLGLGGQTFWCYKFRTMVTNAEDILARDPKLKAKYVAEGFKIKDDPRITPIGHILRKTSLDELPQLLNVLNGDMSLIGPRPIIPEELKKYLDNGDKLLSVKPGLGGLWQVSGRSNVDYPERVKLDMQYVDSCSIRIDFLLFFLTIVAVLKARGAE